MLRYFFPVLWPLVAHRLLLLLLLATTFLGGAANTPGRAQENETVVRFAVIGDSGTGKKGQYEIGRQMARWHEQLPFSTVLMLGDNIYGGLFGWGGGNRKDFAKKFDLPYAELLEKGVWFRASLGNHDLRKESGRHLLADGDRFHIEGENGYYSFAAGQTTDGGPLVEFFALNTGRFDRGRSDPGQLAWLEQALQNSRARWRVVFGHHPMYSTGKKHGADKRLRDMVGPILRDQVQVVLAGHDHFYQRFHPQSGIVYFVDGSSGKLRRGNARPDPQVAAVEDQLHVFMLWVVTEAELRFRAVNLRGEAFDCGVIRVGGVVEEVGCDDWPGLTGQ